MRKGKAEGPPLNLRGVWGGRYVNPCCHTHDLLIDRVSEWSLRQFQISVMPACPESFFVLSNKSEGLRIPNAFGTMTKKLSNS